ncbi:hypothetical protein [Corynebacterium freiburgense]|uniref:hypothetical protein n=1 Tax=Corynebacterium freiburgense TaxID=556548 RepID=UPI000411B0DE|nr:hypothetical protein [Corynebacterium freiburgense]WJZ03425.1 hypothetical protein CFREI_10765 [Corynebacterium freiburgense]
MYFIIKAILALIFIGLTIMLYMRSGFGFDVLTVGAAAVLLVIATIRSAAQPKGTGKPE